MSEERKIDRRELLVRIGKAGAAIAGAGALSYVLYEKEIVVDKNSNLVTLPDYSVKPVDGKQMSIARGGDRVVTLEKALSALGGIERFVGRGDVVAIKPNVAFSSAPMLGATSNPQLVAEVVRLCYKAGAKEVLVTDNPINDPASCFSLSGIGKAVSDAGGKVVLPKERFLGRTTLEKGKLIRNYPILYSPLARANKLIGISPVKDHHRSKASMAMKNWYGLLAGNNRGVFHQDINTIIAELSMMVKPTLVILDGTEVMISNGPTGGSVSDLQRKDTLIASCDMVAADAFGCELLGLQVSDLPYIEKAFAAGVGQRDYKILKPNFIN